MKHDSSRRHCVGRRQALAGAGALLASPTIVRAQGKAGGYALVIGNSKYQWEASLPNVKRDAPDIARCFESLGLKTELVQDVGRDAMNQALDRFKAGIGRGANLAAFYFAGHGAAWAKDTYLVPVDADLSSPNTQSLIPVPGIGQGMGKAGHRLMVFDNCRNNPADGWRQLEAERAASVNLDKQRENLANRSPNTLSLFSTAPGRVALDGPPGENSPFAAALLRQLEEPSVDFQSLPAKMRRDLLVATQGKQVLWDTSTYHEPFMLHGAANRQPGAGRSSWAADPSKIVELPKAYAFAAEHGLYLPPGLISHRPAANSRDAQKIGSFSYIGQSPQGREPQLLIVMSVEEKRTAEIIQAGKNNGVYWRFVTGTLTNERLEYVPRDGAMRFLFDWKDANSGSLTQMPGDRAGMGGSGGGGKGGKPYNTQFTRLDG